MRSTLVFARIPKISMKNAYLPMPHNIIWSQFPSVGDGMWSCAKDRRKASTLPFGSNGHFLVLSGANPDQFYGDGVKKSWNGVWSLIVLKRRLS